MTVLERNGIRSDAEAGPAAAAPRWPFFLVLACLVLEYGRPQSLIGGLSVLRLPALSTALLGIALWISGRVRLDATPTRLFLWLLALMVVHVPLATNNYWAFQMLKTLGLLFIVYLGLVTFVDTPDRFRTLVKVWLGVHVFLAIRGLQHGGRGVAGFLSDENDFALALNMAVPIPILLGLSARSGPQRLVYFGMALLLVVAQITTLSRGGFVGLVATGAFLWWRSRRKVAVLVAIAMLGTVAVQFAPAEYFEEIRSLRAGTEDETATGRIYMWRLTWRMFLDHPVIGVGQGNVPWRFRDYEVATGNEDGLDGRSRAGRAAHSLYLTLLPELGLVGLAIYVGLLGTTWRTLRSIERTRGPGARGAVAGGRGLTDGTSDVPALAVALQASLVGFLVSGAFISVLYYPNMWILLGFAGALARVASEPYGDGTPSH